jgi:rhomboid protease GluP
LYTGTLRDFPVTTVLVAINVVVFVAMVLTSDSFFEALEYGGDAVRWGGNYGPLTLSGDYWRLVTACFIHGGIVHVALNMWCLWSLGRLSERYFGRWSTVAIYLLTGVGGNLLSLAYEPTRFTVGASGAIFGIAGAIIAGLKFGNLSIREGERRAVISSVITFSLINFGLGLGYVGFGAHTDNMAHLGGFISGLLIGVPLATSLTRSAGVNRAIRVATLLVTTALFTAAGAELANSGAPEVRLMRALRNKDYAAAIKILEKKAAGNPNDVQTQLMLGDAYLEDHQTEKAIVAYKKALELDPSLSEVQDILRDLQQNPSGGESSANPQTPSK